ncbi:hypothetical protein C7212DRAFT_222606 [Tuber magnatum]|uniref:Mid2 domain-containing protein n=1 Tax=Tuber magnatum TaxID=42249 RepID=A0A317SHD4_9PEZI|nr:hypothetical protein C7212DRAFT_222606 [Tuber magnatum]
MNLQKRKLFFLFTILGLTCIVVDGRQIAAGAMIVEKRQMESAPGDQVTEVFTLVDTISSPGVTKVAPVTVTRVSTSQGVVTKTSSITPTASSVPPSPSSTTSSSALYCNVGYTLCGTELGGGCCKTGYTCALTGCIPPAGTTAPATSRTCTIASQTLCASSMGFGCCVVGQECGFSSCTPAGGPAVTKVSDVDANNLKLSATATTAAPSTTTTARESGSDETPLSKIAIGGIVGGAVVGIIALAFAWMFTRKHIKKRSNTDASGGVPTTNVFDPTATLSGQHGSHSSQYRGSHPPTTTAAAAATTTKVTGGPKTSEYHPHHPAKVLAAVPPAHSPPLQHSPPAGDQRFDFGIPGVRGGHVYQPVPASDQMPAELGSSPVEGWGMGELQGEGNEVYEVEGDGGGRSPGGKRKSWGWGRNSGTR